MGKLQGRIFRTILGSCSKQTELMDDDMMDAVAFQDQDASVEIKLPRYRQ